MRVFSNLVKSLGLFIAIAPFLTITVKAAGSTPYGGIPWTIPGVIQAEDYDNGGEGVGYHDTDNVNSGGNYRNDGVDIYISNDGSGNRFEVGNTKTGEWLIYTINVTVTASYDIMVRTAASGTGGKFHLEIDGVNISGTQSIPVGVWQGLSTITIPNVSLTSGQHLLKLFMDTQDTTTGQIGNFNWIHFEQVNPVPIITPVQVPSPGSQIFYVSPTGNDSNPGSISQPWKTLAKAASTVTPGQTVYIRAGTYNERLVPKNSGTSDAYIIFANYPGETVTLDGTNIVIPKLEGVVSIHNKSFIRITGLRVINAGVGNPDPSWNMGVMTTYSDHLVIDHLYVGHTYSLGMDISAFTGYSVLDSNEVTDHFGDGESTFALLWYSHHNELKNNYVHDANGEGINSVAGAHDNKIHNNTVSSMGRSGSGIGFYSDAWTEHTYNNEYYNNIAHDDVEGFALSAEAGGLLENIKIYNNIVYNNRYWGIVVSNFPWDNQFGSSHPMKNISIVNNTLYGNDTGFSGNPGIHILNPEATGVLVANNISSRNLNTNYPLSQLTVVNSANVTITNNLFYGGVTSPGSNFVTGNPLFTNLSGTDFTLQSSSTAIDKGTSLNAPAFDFNGASRPAGSAFDIGAYEFGGVIPSPTPIANPSPTPAAKPGDVNGDGSVNILDIGIIIDNYGMNPIPNPAADLNHDGSVNILDIGIVIDNYGK